jgi:hypothetical protein
LRSVRGKSGDIPGGLNDAQHALALRGDQEDSAHLAQEIGTGHAKLVLRQIPRERRQRPGQHQWGRRRAGHHGQLPIVQATRVEVVRIAAAPGLLRLLPTRALARR